MSGILILTLSFCRKHGVNLMQAASISLKKSTAKEYRKKSIMTTKANSQIQPRCSMKAGLCLQSYFLIPPAALSMTQIQAKTQNLHASAVRGEVPQQQFYPF